LGFSVLGSNIFLGTLFSKPQTMFVRYSGRQSLTPKPNDRQNCSF